MICRAKGVLLAGMVALALPTMAQNAKSQKPKAKSAPPSVKRKAAAPPIRQGSIPTASCNGGQLLRSICRMGCSR